MELSSNKEYQTTKRYSHGSEFVKCLLESELRLLYTDIHVVIVRRKFEQ